MPLFSERPEEEEAFLKRLKAGQQRISEREAQQVGQARGQALARGLTGDPFEASAVGAVQQGASRDITEFEAGLYGEAAQASREERRLAEARKYQTGEREASQLFGAGEAEKGRLYGTSERLGSETFGAGQAKLGREYGTSEREAAQVFGAGEAEKGRAYGTSERLGSQQFAAGEAASERALREKLSGQQLAQQQAQYEQELVQRGYDRAEAAKQAKRAAEEGRLSDVIGAGATLAGGYLAGAFKGAAAKGASTLASTALGGKALTAGVGGAVSAGGAGTAAGTGGLAAGLGTAATIAAPIAGALYLGKNIQRVSDEATRAKEKVSGAVEGLSRRLIGGGTGGQGPQDAAVNYQQAQGIVRDISTGVSSETGGALKLPPVDKAEMDKLAQRHASEISNVDRTSSQGKMILARQEKELQDARNRIKTMYADFVAAGPGAPFPGNREPGESYEAFVKRSQGGEDEEEALRSRIAGIPGQSGYSYNV